MLERPIYTFDFPFCPNAEYRYFYDLLDRVITPDIHVHSLVSRATVFLINTETIDEGDIMWKRPPWGHPTGLCINGQGAGFLVDWAGRHYTVSHRTLAIDGAGFDEVKARQHRLVEQLPEPVRTHIRTLLQMPYHTMFYPYLITTLLQASSYPVDVVRFMKNIKEGADHFEHTALLQLKEPSLEGIKFLSE
jgi:hypothetical protein